MLSLVISVGEAQAAPSQASSEKQTAKRSMLNSPSSPIGLKDQKYWVQQRREYRVLTNNSWAQEQWTGDDKPFALTRSQVELNVANGLKPQALVERYAGRAEREPNNALAQFRWAYAVHLSVKSASFPQEKAANLRYRAEVALAEVTSPHSYNYDRLRFLLWIQGGGGAPSHFLEGMAHRLLQKAPGDFPVLVDLASIYTQNRDKVAQQKGYVLIRQMIKDYPDKPQCYDMLGGWHYTQYMFYHKHEDYQAAQTNYQKAMRLYPVTSARKAQLPKVMQYLQTRYHQISGG